MYDGQSCARTLFLVFTMLAAVLVPGVPPKLWYVFGFVVVALYIAEKWKGMIQVGDQQASERKRDDF